MMGPRAPRPALRVKSDPQQAYGRSGAGKAGAETDPGGRYAHRVRAMNRRASQLRLLPGRHGRTRGQAIVRNAVGSFVKPLARSRCNHMRRWRQCWPFWGNNAASFCRLARATTSASRGSGAGVTVGDCEERQARPAPPLPPLSRHSRHRDLLFAPWVELHRQHELQPAGFAASDTGRADQRPESSRCLPDSLCW